LRGYINRQRLKPPANSASRLKPTLDYLEIGNSIYKTLCNFGATYHRPNKH